MSVLVVSVGSGVLVGVGVVGVGLLVTVEVSAGEVLGLSLLLAVPVAAGAAVGLNVMTSTVLEAVTASGETTSVPPPASVGPVWPPLPPPLPLLPASWLPVADGLGVVRASLLLSWLLSWLMDGRSTTARLGVLAWSTALSSVETRAASTRAEAATAG